MSVKILEGVESLIFCVVKGKWSPHSCSPLHIDHHAKVHDACLMCFMWSCPQRWRTSVCLFASPWLAKHNTSYVRVMPCGRGLSRSLHLSSRTREHCMTLCEREWISLSSSLKSYLKAKEPVLIAKQILDEPSEDLFRSFLGSCHPLSCVDLANYLVDGLADIARNIAWLVWFFS